MQCPECGMGRPGHKWDCPRAPVLTLGPRTADDAALQPEAWRGIESAIAAKTREPIFLEMRDIYMGQAGYRTPGQIADAAWFTGQPNPGATIPAAPLTDGGKAE